MKVSIFNGCPVLLKGSCLDWDLSQFEARLLLSGGDLQNTAIKWRVCPLTTQKSVPEFQNTIIQASFREFTQYFRSTNDSMNPFSMFPPITSKKISIYGDYQHFSEIFSQGKDNQSHDIPIPVFGKWNDIFENYDSHIINPVDSVFPIDPQKATLWVGTEGAHTPLHYDTYGVNIVAQVSGTKRWKLWKPNLPHEDERIPSSRIPYEESSVYSSYDPKGIDTPASTPGEASSCSLSYLPPDYEITLEKGDMLFVPRHWWHFVETTSELSISVNIWLPAPTLIPAPPAQLDASNLIGVESPFASPPSLSSSILPPLPPLPPPNPLLSAPLTDHLSEALTKWIFCTLAQSVSRHTLPMPMPMPMPTDCNHHPTTSKNNSHNNRNADSFDPMNPRNGWVNPSYSPSMTASSVSCLSLLPTQSPVGILYTPREVGKAGQRVGHSKSVGMGSEDKKRRYKDDFNEIEREIESDAPMKKSKAQLTQPITGTSIGREGQRERKGVSERESGRQREGGREGEREGESHATSLFEKRENLDLEDKGEEEEEEEEEEEGCEDDEVSDLRIVEIFWHEVKGRGRGKDLPGHMNVGGHGGHEQCQAAWGRGGREEKRDEKINEDEGIEIERDDEEKLRFLSALKNVVGSLIHPLSIQKAMREMLQTGDEINY